MRASWFGYNPPFLTDTSVMRLQLDERLIKNDLLQLLLTVPGERVMRPNFGTPVRTTPFEQNDQDLEDSLRTAILTQIDRFEERVTIQDLLFNKDEDNNTLEITLLGFLTTSEDIRERFELELNLPVESLV